MADGRVITGFSHPYVATYTKGASGTPTYSNGKVLARGVDVSISAESSGSNDFYGDNQIIESVSGRFSGGTVTLTVDGLNEDVEKFILGLPAPDTVTVGSDSVKAYRYGDAMVVPEVGIGFVMRCMSGGVTTYIPVILHRCKFNTPDENAATEGESIDWQTQELTATIYRDESDNHNWKTKYEAQTTEAKAIAVLTTVLG